jgi:hypothetical protein
MVGSSVRATRAVGSRPLYGTMWCRRWKWDLYGNHDREPARACPYQADLWSSAFTLCHSSPAPYPLTRGLREMQPHRADRLSADAARYTSACTTDSRATPATTSPVMLRIMSSSGAPIVQYS